MQLAILIALGALFYAGFQIFAALAGGKIDNWLAVVLYNGLSAVLALSLYVSLRAKGKTTFQGIMLATLAGVSILAFSVVLARIFSKGGNLAYVIPTMYGSAIVLSSLFGWWMLKEQLNILQAIGLGLVVLGVLCVIISKLKFA